MARRPDFTPKTRAQIAYYMQLNRRFRQPPAPSSIASLMSTLLSGASQLIAHPLDYGSMFQDRAGTTPVTEPGQQVGHVLDAGPGGYHATAISNAARAIFREVGGVRWLDHNGINTDLRYASAPDAVGMRALSTPHGHQIDNDVPLSGTRLPLLTPVMFIRRAPAASPAQVTQTSEYLPGSRQYFTPQTIATSLANLRMVMTNGETPVLRVIGANGVETTVTLGSASLSSANLASAGLTAPFTLLFPFPSNPAALTQFYCYANQLTGSIPSLTNNTALTHFYCFINQLTGSIPSLTNNTALTQFSCYANQLTGSIPDLTNNTALTHFSCYANQLTGSIPDLTNNTALTQFYCYVNQLTGWDGGALPASLTDFRAHNNALPQATVDALLAALDTAGASTGTCKLEGGTNAAPSAAGEDSIDSLRGRGWTVTVTGGY